jgi:hypothetical protein
MSLCTCDPEKEYDLECFVHSSYNKQKLKTAQLEKKLAVAMEALIKISIRCDHDELDGSLELCDCSTPMKMRALEALSKIRGSNADA